MSNNNNPQSPWGGNNNKANNNQTPPDLDDVINDLKSKFGSLFGDNNANNSDAEIINDNSNSNNPNGFKLKYILILAAIIWLGSGFYIIDPAEKGVVLRFGAITETVNDGPHWHMPSPIEQVRIVNVAQVRTAEIGFRTMVNSAGNKFTRNILEESIMLTSDGNIVDASFEVQYTINDIEHYLFSIKNPEKTIEQVANSVIREVVGKHKIDYTITEGRFAIAQEVKTSSQKILDFYKTGIHINTVNLKSSQAPAQVQAAYSDVTKAKTDKERYINQAQSYANGILPKARGESARMIEEANAYKSQIVSKAEGESSRFTQLLAEYEKSPEVTKERLYRETMEQVFANTSKVIMEKDGNSLMYLPIDKLIQENNKQIPITSKVENNISNTNPTSIRNAFRNRGAL